MINTTYFLAVLLIFIRLLSFTTLVPIFFPTGTPSKMKIFFSGIIALVIVPSIDISGLSAISNNSMLVMYIVNEVMTGLALGFITDLCFRVMMLAGQLMDTQIGLSMISMFDPNANATTSLLERLLYWMSFLIFLMIDGHHMLITALVQSFNKVGLGQSLIFNQSIMVIINSITDYFVIGLKIAIPIVLIILIADIAMGLISRAVPQINLMVLGLPVKILLGITAFTLAIPLMMRAMIIAFEKIPSVYDDIFRAVPMILIFASEDKTEQATPRKQKEARKKGQIAKSKEVSLALTLVAITLVLMTLAGFVGGQLQQTMAHYLSFSINETSYNSLNALATESVIKIGTVLLPVILPIMVMGIVANYIQTGFLFTGEPLKPDLKKLNPLNGFKKMFSGRTFVELFKQIIIVTLLGYMGYKYVMSNYNDIMKIGYLNINQIPGQFGKIVLGILMQVTLVMFIIAIADYVYQRFMHGKEMRMSKQEVKEEYKQDEGDPQIKSKIKQRQREMASRRMMASIPDATVVITNPTHLAVALKYKEGETEAPLVVAKGADALAIKIKEVAKENDVPIIENKPLARLIYSDVEVDQEIPVDMFQAVAEILAIVYKMKKKK